MKEVIMIADWHKSSDGNVIEYEKAAKFVEGKRAVWIDENTIKLLMDRKRFKKYIKNRDNHTCFYCGEHGETLDHVVPRAEGGIFTLKNTVCACHDCNNGRKDSDIDEYFGEGTMRKLQAYLTKVEGVVR